MTERSRDGTRWNEMEKEEGRRRRGGGQWVEVDRGKRTCWTVVDRIFAARFVICAGLLSPRGIKPTNVAIKDRSRHGRQNLCPQGARKLRCYGDGGTAIFPNSNEETNPESFDPPLTCLLICFGEGGGARRGEWRSSFSEVSSCCMFT